jgi:hypothetical protein
VVANEHKSGQKKKHLQNLCGLILCTLRLRKFTVNLNETRLSNAKKNHFGHYADLLSGDSTKVIDIVASYFTDWSIPVHKYEAEMINGRP